MPWGAMAGNWLRLEYGMPSRRSGRPFTVWSSATGPSMVAPASVHDMSIH